MADVDFMNLLDRPVGDVERPKPFPEGHYHAVILEQEFTKSKEKQTPGIKFTAKIVRPVGENAEEIGQALEQVKNWQERKHNFTAWLSEDSLWRLKDLLFACKVIDDEDDPRSLKELVGELRQAEFVAEIKHEHGDPDPATGERPVFARIDGWARLD